jgi:hypothetical protein
MQVHCDVVTAEPAEPAVDETESKDPETQDAAPAKSKSPARREKEKTT